MQARPRSLATVAVRATTEVGPMSTTNARRRKVAEANGVPMVDISFARAERDRERVKLEWQYWGRMALMSLSLVAVAGCSVAQAEEHTHRWQKTETFSNDCCARWDLEVGTDDDGNKAFIRRCGKKGTRVTLWYECECGGKKTWSSGCAAVD